MACRPNAVGCQYHDGALAAFSRMCSILPSDPACNQLQGRHRRRPSTARPRRAPRARLCATTASAASAPRGAPGNCGSCVLARSYPQLHVGYSYSSRDTSMSSSFILHPSLRQQVALYDMHNYHRSYHYHGISATCHSLFCTHHPNNREQLEAQRPQTQGSASPKRNSSNKPTNTSTKSNFVSVSVKPQILHASPHFTQTLKSNAPRIGNSRLSPRRRILPRPDICRPPRCALAARSRSENTLHYWHSAARRSIYRT